LHGLPQLLQRIAVLDGFSSWLCTACGCETARENKKGSVLKDITCSTTIKTSFVRPTNNDN